MGLVGTMAATMAGAIAMVGNMVKWGAIFGGFGRDDDEGGGMVGMLTFREVLKALQSAGGSLTSMHAADIMVRDPVCGDPEQTIDELREIMTRHHVRYLPVKDGDRLLSIVSFHDAAKAIIKETSMENRLLKRYIESQPSERPQ